MMNNGSQISATGSAYFAKLIFGQRKKPVTKHEIFLVKLLAVFVNRADRSKPNIGPLLLVHLAVTFRPMGISAAGMLAALSCPYDLYPNHG